MSIMDTGLILYAGAIGLIVIGIAGAVIVKNMFRILLALAIAEAGANLLLLLAGFRFDATAPIVNTLATHVAMVDPVPQAMVLTSIVIGVGVQALALGLVVQVYNKYNALDISVLGNELEQTIAREAGVAPVSSDESPARQHPLQAPVQNMSGVDT